MASKAKFPRKIISLFLSFILFFTQTGFAQVASVELNLTSHFAKFSSNFAQEKFRLPHLRYFSYDNSSNNIQMLLDKGDLKGLKDLKLQESGKQLLKYFLIGVTLPDDNFWVNLRPDSKDNIIPDLLAKTDIGKIFLETDVQLKKDTAAFTAPNTVLGKLYWDKLYQKAAQIYGTQNVNIPTLTRPWIVPGEIIIREAEGSSAYIYKATLKVMLEQDHLQGSTTYNFSDIRAKELNEYSSQLIRELILPELTKKVNNSKDYAALRQVYYSLILARWFKSRFYGKGGLYASYINKSNLKDLTSNQTWSKDTYFKQYQSSFKNGEYNLQTNVSAVSGQSIRSYFSGGIELGPNMNIITQNKQSSPIAGFTGSSPVFMNAATKNGLVPFSGVVKINNPISITPGISSSPVSFQDSSIKIDIKGAELLGGLTTKHDFKYSLYNPNIISSSLILNSLSKEFFDGNARIAVYRTFDYGNLERKLLFEIRSEKGLIWVAGPDIYRFSSDEWIYKVGNISIKIFYDSVHRTLTLAAADSIVLQHISENFQVFLEPISASSPLNIQPVSSLRVYSDINQRIWLDGLTFEMLLSGEFENLVRTHGINGVTTNPSLIKAYLSDPRVMDKAKELASQGLDRKTIYYQLVSELAKTALGIFEKAGVKNAKFSVELNPAVNNTDVAQALKEALLWTNIDPEHMMIKVALSSDENGVDNQIGYQIVEAVISRGRNVNVTLIFTPTQYYKVVDAYIRGLQRGLINVKSGKLSKEEFNRVYSVASFFISRWDVYFEENKLVPKNSHGKVANAIAIEAYNKIFKDAFSDNNPSWKELKADAAALGLKIKPQEFLLASTGSKGADLLKKGIIDESIAADYPAGIYVHPLQGPFVVNTLPYGTIKHLIEKGVAKNKDGSIAKTIESGYASSRQTIGLILESNADITQIGAILLKNATTAFSNDYNSVQNSLDNVVNGTVSSPVVLTEQKGSFTYKEEPIVSGQLPQEVLDLYSDPIILEVLSKNSSIKNIRKIGLDPSMAKYVKYGTSGDRDVIYDEDPTVVSRFNVQRVLRDAQGIASYYKANKLNGPVRIGYETRLMAREYAYLTAAVLAANGIKVKLPANAVPLPSLAFSVVDSQETNDPDAGGIMITASHNPWQWLGIKWLLSNGGAAPATVTEPLQKITREITEASVISVSEALNKSLIDMVDYKQDYINYILNNIPVDAKIALKKWGSKENNKVISNPVQGGAIGYVPQILQNLGIKYEEKNNTIDRMFGGSDKRGPNPDYAPDFDKNIAQAYKEGKNVIEIMQDVDADRFGVRDVNGIRYTANELIPMYKWFLRTKGYKGAIGKTIPTSDFSNAVDKYWGDKTLEVDTGFKNLVDPLESGEYIVVGEESAHVGIGIWKKSKDDGIAVGLLAAWIVAETGKSLTEYKKEIESTIGAHFKYRRIDTPYKGARKFEGAQMLELINLGEAAGVVKRNNGEFEFVYKGNEDKFINLPIINEKIIPVANRYGGLSKVLICYDPLSEKSSGYKMVFADNSVVTVRVSGTGEPVIRTYLEIVTPCTKETWDKIDAGSDARWQELADRAREVIGIYSIENGSSSPIGYSNINNLNLNKSMFFNMLWEATPGSVIDAEKVKEKFQLKDQDIKSVILHIDQLKDSEETIYLKKGKIYIPKAEDVFSSSPVETESIKVSQALNDTFAKELLVWKSVNGFPIWDPFIEGLSSLDPALAYGAALNRKELIKLANNTVIKLVEKYRLNEKEAVSLINALANKLKLAGAEIQNKSAITSIRAYNDPAQNTVAQVKAVKIIQMPKNKHIISMRAKDASGLLRDLKVDFTLGAEDIENNSIEVGGKPMLLSQAVKISLEKIVLDNIAKGRDSFTSKEALGLMFYGQENVYLNYGIDKTNANTYELTGNVYGGAGESSLISSLEATVTISSPVKEKIVTWNEIIVGLKNLTGVSENKVLIFAKILSNELRDANQRIKGNELSPEEFVLIASTVISSLEEDGIYEKYGLSSNDVAMLSGRVVSIAFKATNNEDFRDDVELLWQDRDTASSPVSVKNMDKGGIDFRALPMTIQPMGSFQKLTFSLPAASSLAQINIS
ncbi:MAG: hypothetical protein M0Q96_00855, partial [Candidatus Omnitrophica bacterium]|nr:hypothetical protein [Candidatus Omnitrophota bacterium]